MAESSVSALARQDVTTTSPSTLFGSNKITFQNQSFSNSADVFTYIRSLPDDQQYDAASMWYGALGKVADTVDENRSELYQYIKTNNSIRNGKADDAWQEELNNDFEDGEEVVRRVEAKRSKRNEKITRITARWPDARDHPAIVGNLAISRLENISKLASRHNVTFRQALNAANRHALARIRVGRNMDTLTTAKDWDNASQPNQNFKNITQAELAAVTTMRLGITADGSLVVLIDAQGMSGPRITEVTGDDDDDLSTLDDRDVLDERDYQDLTREGVALGYIRTSKTSAATTQGPANSPKPGLDQRLANQTQEIARRSMRVLNTRVREFEEVEQYGSDDEEYDNAPTGSKRKRLDTGQGVPTSDGRARGCHCDDTIAERVTRLTDACSYTDADAIGLVTTVLRYHRRGIKVCKLHLNHAGSRCGFSIRMWNAQQAIVYLQLYKDNFNDLHTLRTKAATANLFLLSRRPARAADVRGVMKYEHIGAITATTPDDYLFNADAVLESLFPGAVQEFRAQGTVNMDIFTWWEGAGLMDIFLEEIEMYKHHHRILPNKSDLGWLRNMFHSLAQQAMRMDLTYYTAYCCLRPDNATWLISYPYYAKYTVPGSKTYFLHIDGTPEKMVDLDEGVSMIQGSVALTDDDGKNSTIMLSGMHRIIEGWWADVKKRGDDVHARGDVVSFTNKNLWSQADVTKFDIDWKKVPCKKGQARISMPTIAHGSTGPATAKRITMLPWFERILANHEDMELPDGGNYESIAAAHRDLLPGIATPSGRPILYGRVSRAFPAAIHLETTCAISAALVGRVRWDNARVIEERDALLGPDRQAAQQIVANQRAEVTKNVKSAWELVKKYERRSFGIKSYFYCKENNVDAPDMDDPDPHAEDVAATAAEEGGSEAGSVDDETADLLLEMEVGGGGIAQDEDLVGATDRALRGESGV